MHSVCFFLTELTTLGGGLIFAQHCIQSRRNDACIANLLLHRDAKPSQRQQTAKMQKVSAKSGALK